MSDTVTQSLHDGVLSLTLNRPEKLNAFNDEMHRALRAGFDTALNDVSVRAVLLTGTGRAFCAGQDLGDRDPAKTPAPDLGATLEQFYNPLVRQIRALEKPVVCAVNGVAAGAGANIAFNCDIVVAARSAKFVQAFSKIGLIPDSGGTWHLSRLLGEARAKALTFTGDPIDAATAAAWGLIWKVIEDDQLAETAITLAQRLAQGATFGLGLTKRAIHAAATQSLNEHLDLERDLQRLAGKSADYAEGVSAFLQKRKPEFRGS